MIEEHLERIDSKLDGLVAGLARLETGQTKLEAGQAKLEARQENLEAGQAKLEARQENLEAGQAKLEARQENLEAGQVKLEAGLEEVRAGQISMGNQMRALYEDALDRMKALDPRPEIATLRREIADAHDGVIRRLDVIEVAVSELWRRQAPQ